MPVSGQRDKRMLLGALCPVQLGYESSIGLNTTAQKLGDIATAVMAAIFTSETCSAAQQLRQNEQDDAGGESRLEGWDRKQQS